MMEEMAGLGFKRVELSHGIRSSLVPGILKAVDEAMVEISSVHNFCPLPSGINHAAPNLFEPSTSCKRERIYWGRYTKHTLDFAEKTKANNVIMHLGSARFFFRSPAKKLSQWIRSNDLNVLEFATNKKFLRKRDHALRRIQKASRNAMQHVEANYTEAIEWANDRNLKLCIENREGLAEMPLDSDLAGLIDSFSPAGQIGYWHDTGHAQIKHHLGLLDHSTHLSVLKEHIAGFHLHDVIESGADHQPVGTGTVDFRMIAEFIRPGHELVLELSPRLSSSDVLASRDYICSLFG